MNGTGNNQPISAETVPQGAKHTPTPWRSSANSFGTQFIYGDLENPRKSPMGVTYCELVCGGDNPTRLTEANAAFIVRAVNNHDALVKALEAAQVFAESVLEMHGPDHAGLNLSTLNKIDSALAAARGEA